MSSAAMWRTLASVFTVAVLIAGVLVTWALLRPNATVNTNTTYATYDRTIARLVFVAFGDSDAIITGTSGREVKVRRELRWSGDKQPVAAESWNDETLTVGHNCGELSRHICSMRYNIMVPPEVEVEVRTTAGDVSARNMTGRLAVEVVSGDVRLEEDSGPVTVTSVSGDITGSGLRCSDVEVHGVSGDVNLGFASAPQRVAVEKVSGDTWVRVPKGTGPYRVDVDTTSGDRNVSVETASGAERAIGVQSTSGDVTVAYL